MELLSMTDFVLEQTELFYDKNQSKLIHNIVNYAQFLKQPLKLEMFVPCDDNGSFLEEPNKKDYVFEHHPELVGNPKEYDEDRYRDDCLEWIMAKEKVLFEGFEVKGNYIMYYDFAYIMKYELEGKTVENIIDEIPNNSLQLTQNALKQFM